MAAYLPSRASAASRHTSGSLRRGPLSRALLASPDRGAIGSADGGQTTRIGRNTPDIRRPARRTATGRVAGFGSPPATNAGDTATATSNGVGAPAPAWTWPHPGRDARHHAIVAPASTAGRRSAPGRRPRHRARATAWSAGIRGHGEAGAEAPASVENTTMHRGGAPARPGRRGIPRGAHAPTPPRRRPASRSARRSGCRTRSTSHRSCGPARSRAAHGGRTRCATSAPRSGSRR